MSGFAFQNLTFNDEQETQSPPTKRARLSSRELQAETMDLEQSSENDFSNQDLSGEGFPAEHSLHSWSIQDNGRRHPSGVQKSKGTGTNKARGERNTNNPAQSDAATRLVKVDPVHGLMWHDEADDSWYPAVYHHDLRDDLLRRASNGGSLRYTHPRASGKLAHDFTAYHPEQKGWKDARSK